MKFSEIDSNLAAPRIMEASKVQKLYTKKASLYQFLFLDVLGVHKKIKDFLQQSDYIKSNFRILDAGGGTGNVTKALYEISIENKYENVTFHAFDLTQAMLDLFQQWIDKVKAKNITIKQNDVMRLEQLPADWKGYDLIVSSAMLEYLPRDQMRTALRGLKSLLKPNGKLLIFITKSNFITKWFIGWYWKANLYKEKELQQIFHDAGLDGFMVANIWWGSFIAVEARG